MSNDVTETILVAVDGSPAARAAAEVAIQIARGRHGAVRGAYVVDEELVLDTYADHAAELGESVESTSRADLVARYRAQGEAALLWLSEQCRAADVPVTTDLALGRVTELLLQNAGHASLLALGRRGNRRAAATGQLGAHFRAIAHHSPCAVLVGGASPPPLRHLLLAYNDSDRAREALTWTSRLQQALGADVAVVAARLSSGDAADSWLQRAREQLPPDALRYRFTARAGDPVAQIVAAAEGHADLVLLGGYRHGAAVEWIVGSTVDGVLTRTELPVLVA